MTLRRSNQLGIVQELGQYGASPNLVYAILFAGIVLRVSGVSISALHYDEAFSLTVARQGLFEMVQNLTMNISPPGWELVVWLSARVFGFNEVGVRIVPLLANIAALWIAYRLTQELDLRPAYQIIALVILTFLPYQFWIAQEARTYAIYGLLYTLGILWALQGRWLGLAAVMGLMLWFHNTAVFYAPTLALLAFVRHPRAWKTIFVATFLAGLTWVIWLPVVFPQAGQIIPFFPSFTLAHFATNLEGAFFSGALREGWALFGFLAIILGTIVALWSTLASLGAWITWRIKIGDSANSSSDAPGRPHPFASAPFLLMLAVMAPTTLFLAYTALSQNVFLFRPLSPMVPAWIMWLAPFIAFQTTQRNGRMFARALLPALWTLVMVAGVVGWSPDRTSNLRSAVELIKTDWQAGDVVYYSSGLVAGLFQNYLPDRDQFLIDEERSVQKAMIRLMDLRTPQAALENLGYQRAWVIWLRDVESNPRMVGYIRNCQLVGKMFFWQSSQETEVYLCSKR